MIKYSGHVKGVEELTAKLKQVQADLKGQPVTQAMQEATLAVTGSARRYAPVDTGRLRASIMPSVTMTGETVKGVVGSNVKYAAYMELGTRRFWPPIKKLQTWARRHGISAYLVARSIARYGLAARRYLQRGFEENKPRVISVFEMAVNRIVNK